MRNNRILSSENGRNGVYYRLSDLLSWGEQGYGVGELLRIE